MPDAIDILASGAAHGNVTSTLHGQTPLPTGWKRGEIPLALQKKGDGVDVSDYATLRLSLDVTSLLSARGYENGDPLGCALHVAVEHLVDGAWLPLHRFNSMRHPGSQTAIVSAFGTQVRASWYIARTNPEQTHDVPPTVTWGLTASAAPSLPA